MGNGRYDAAKPPAADTLRYLDIEDYQVAAVAQPCVRRIVQESAAIVNDVVRFFGAGGLAVFLRLLVLQAVRHGKLQLHYPANLERGRREKKIVKRETIMMQDFLLNLQLETAGIQSLMRDYRDRLYTLTMTM